VEKAEEEWRGIKAQAYIEEEEKYTRPVKTVRERKEPK